MFRNRLIKRRMWPPDWTLMTSQAIRRPTSVTVKVRSPIAKLSGAQKRVWLSWGARSLQTKGCSRDPAGENVVPNKRKLTLAPGRFFRVQGPAWHHRCNWENQSEE